MNYTLKRPCNAKKEVDVSEWTDEAKMYFRPLNSFETLMFYDLFADFVNPKKTAEERWVAGFEAAKLALVDENDAPVFTDEDREQMKEAAFVPIRRVFNVGLEFTTTVETTKKN